MRILLVHYIFPAVLYTLVLVFLSFEDALANVIFGSLLVLAFGLSLALTRRKYLYSFDLVNGGLEISYYNVFLRRRVVQVSAGELAGIGWVQIDPITQCPTLKVRVADKWQGFSILSKGLRDAARLFFRAANVGIM